MHSGSFALLCALNFYILLSLMTYIKLVGGITEGERKCYQRGFEGTVERRMNNPHRRRKKVSAT